MFLKQTKVEGKTSPCQCLNWFVTKVITGTMQSLDSSCQEADVSSIPPLLSRIFIT